MTDYIPLNDLQAQRLRLEARLDARIARVLEHGRFILGPEVAEFEEKLAAFSGVSYCVSCANGTDAIMLALMARDVGAGDAVFVPAFTFAATAEAVAILGATPIFCDVDKATFNMSPESLRAAILLAEQNGLRAKAVLPVDLFGQPADYPAIQSVADDHGLTVIADAAQSCGARLGNHAVGGHAEMTALSFFPSKPLGCYGDGGAVLTEDGDLAARLRSLRVHGTGENKYDNVRIGLNSRLDTLQAAILLEKLEIFPVEIAARQAVAARYAAAFANSLGVPAVIEGAEPVWAQYTIVTDNRDVIARRLDEQGIANAIYYPKPISEQPGYADYPGVPTNSAAWLSARVLSLPMSAYLDTAAQDRVIAAVTD